MYPFTTFHRSTRWRCLVLVLGLLPACRDEADIDEVPEVAEVEVEPRAVEVSPEGVAVEAEVRLEDAFPLTAEDVGDVIVATGTVVGTPLPTGFFLKTEGIEVFLVESTVPVAPGARVRVVGPLGMVTQAVFDEWEVDSFQSEVEAEWDIQHRWFIDATAVTPV